MAWTTGQLTAEVRNIVQDKHDTRYSDERILQAAQTALSEVRRLRPDYFFDRMREDLPDLVATGLADPDTIIPLPGFLRSPMTAFTAGWVELVDDQFTDDGRALGLMKILAGSLMRAPSP